MRRPPPLPTEASVKTSRRGSLPEIFLVERYWSGMTGADVRSAMERLADAISAMRGEGIAIRHLRSVLVPADESVLCLFEAADVADVVEANRRAGVPFDRVSAAVACETRNGDDVAHA
jgi:hypothetical protein